MCVLPKECLPMSEGAKTQTEWQDHQGERSWGTGMEQPAKHANHAKGKGILTADGAN